MLFRSTGPIRNAKKRAKILRVFDAIESQQQASGLWVAGDRRNGLEEIFDRQKLLRTHHCNHTLMRGRSRKLRKLLARLLSNAHAGLATFGNQTRKAVILAFARDNNMIEAPPSGSESLLYRVEAIENFHRVSVRVIKQRAA